MDTIANNNEMMNEMTGAIKNSNNGKMFMQKNEKIAMMIMENRGTMMKILKNNPEMMQHLFSDMMETAKDDSNMMSGISKTIMRNQQMMSKLQEMRGENMNMNKIDGEKNTNMMENGNNKKNNMDGKNNMNGKNDMDGTNKMEEMNNMDGMNKNR